MDYSTSMLNPLSITVLGVVGGKDVNKTHHLLLQRVDFGVWVLWRFILLS